MRRLKNSWETLTSVSNLTRDSISASQIFKRRTSISSQNSKTSAITEDSLILTPLNRKKALLTVITQIINWCQSARSPESLCMINSTMMRLMQGETTGRTITSMKSPTVGAGLTLTTEKTSRVETSIPLERDSKATGQEASTTRLTRTKASILSGCQTGAPLCLVNNETSDQPPSLRRSSSRASRLRRRRSTTMLGWRLPETLIIDQLHHQFLWKGTLSLSPKIMAMAAMHTQVLIPR